MSIMYLMYYLDDAGNRVYSLKASFLFLKTPRATLGWPVDAPVPGTRHTPVKSSHSGLPTHQSHRDSGQMFSGLATNNKPSCWHPVIT